MRLIGQLADETAARTFGDYLYVQGIENQVESQPGQGWAVWVNDEDKVELAASLLHMFRENTGDPKYQTVAKKAAVLRDDAEKDVAAYRRKVNDRRNLFKPLADYGFGPLTFALIVISVVVAFVSNLGGNLLAIHLLFIADPLTFAVEPGLTEVLHGQVWRLITPIFIHFGILHILFNMLWLRDLGSMIEDRQSTLQLLALVVVIAIASNLAQYFYAGPMFGGMSGVVYGLLGYIWMRGKFDPASGLFLHPTTVTMMLIWFFLCFTPLLPNVANATHAVGLVIGMAWGYLSSLRFR